MKIVVAPAYPVDINEGNIVQEIDVPDSLGIYIELEGAPIWAIKQTGGRLHLYELSDTTIEDN